MECNDLQTWRKWEVVVNVLLIAVALFTLARVAWGSDSEDRIWSCMPGSQTCESPGRSD